VIECFVRPCEGAGTESHGFCDLVVGFFPEGSMRWEEPIRLRCAQPPSLSREGIHDSLEKGSYHRTILPVTEGVLVRPCEGAGDRIARFSRFGGGVLSQVSMRREEPIRPRCAQPPSLRREGIHGSLEKGGCHRTILPVTEGFLSVPEKGQETESHGFYEIPSS
jgi:hypothetical protein